MSKLGRWYVGVSSDVHEWGTRLERTVFASVKRPTVASHGSEFWSVTGPCHCYDCACTLRDRRDLGHADEAFRYTHA